MDVLGHDQRSEFHGPQHDYNYYDFGTRTWNWIDHANRMLSGVGVYGKRAGYGNVDVDPASGVALVGGHVFVDSPSIRPWLARDAAPGAGIFEYADSMDLGVTQWPPIAVGQDGRIDVFPCSDAYALSYSQVAPDSWPNFSPELTGMAPSPGFPTHGIAASKASSKVALVWEISANTPQDAYQMHSTDGGMTWDTPATLDPPDAYGGDTVTSDHLASLFPWYDRQDKFHVAANLMPMVNDTGRILPSQIWHYCRENSPQWSRVHVASVDPTHYINPITSNATLACRPSIGQDGDGNLFVAWEQFDTLNFEPTTSRARADIFGSKSTNGGLSWGPALKLTDAGTHSVRFPSIIDLAIDGDPDTVCVIYLVDSVAGFYVAAGTLPSEGPATPNPVVVQKVPADSFGTAVAEPKDVTWVALEAAAWPNPFDNSTRVSYAVPHRGRAALDIFDAVGRPVRTLVNGRGEPGRFSVIWDGRSQSGALVPAGVYVYRYALDSKQITGRLTLTR